MSWAELPPELIVEQLRYLSLVDLLNACQTNQYIKAVCNRPELWYARLQDDFAVIDLSSISNPQAYYFELLDKRAYILDYILSTITEDYFNHNLDLFNQDYDFDDYIEFVETQQAYVQGLTAEDIVSIYSLLELILPNSKIWHPGLSNPTPTELFFFDWYGQYNFSIINRY